MSSPLRLTVNLYCFEESFIEKMECGWEQAVLDTICGG